MNVVKSLKRGGIDQLAFNWSDPNESVHAIVNLFDRFHFFLSLMLLAWAACLSHAKTRAQRALAKSKTWKVRGAKRPHAKRLFHPSHPLASTLLVLDDFPEYRQVKQTKIRLCVGVP